MAEVIIENEQNKVEIDDKIEKIIRKVVEKTLESEEFTSKTEVSVTVTDNDNIQKINLAQRDIDAATDVLSFPMLCFDENGDAVVSEFDIDGENVLLGDIVISAERAAEQAKEYGHSFEREIAFLTVHSMLHLLGYDHIDDPEGERIMFSRQEEILQELGITRDI